MLTNCKNCGAPIKGNCEYCGTQYIDINTSWKSEFYQNMQMAGISNQTATGIRLMHEKQNFLQSIQNGLLQAGSTIVGRGWIL